MRMTGRDSTTRLVNILRAEAEAAEAEHNAKAVQSAVGFAAFVQRLVVGLVVGGVLVASAIVPQLWR